MATVTLSSTNGGIGGGSAVAGVVDVVTAGFAPSQGFVVGVYKGETGQVVVGLRSDLSGTAGAAACGEPAFDGKEVVVTAEQLQLANAGLKTIYVTAVSGTVPYWVKAVP